MTILYGAEALEYAQQVGMRVWRQRGSAEPEALQPDAATEIAKTDAKSIFISLAYTGYVLTDAQDILLQLRADNQWGFDLTDGESSWPGGIGIAKQVMPINENQVPAALRARLDPLRRRR